MAPQRVLVVDDYDPFCRLISSTLQSSGFDVVGHASNGLEAVAKADELDPDLILLDVGLPKLAGTMAAKRIRELAPGSRILFLSQESSPDVIREALNSGGLGYVHKVRARTDLLPAIESVLAGKRFVSGDFEECGLRDRGSSLSHSVQFCCDDAVFLKTVSHFVATALEAGNPAIVVATKPHREGLLQALAARGVDPEAAIRTGLYVPLDAAETLSTLMIDGWPDQARVFGIFRNAMEVVSQTAGVERSRVAFFGEGTALLCAQGKTDAAIRLEQLGNEFVATYGIDLLCAYPSRVFCGEKGEMALRTLCATHSVTYSC